MRVFLVGLVSLSLAASLAAQTRGTPNLVLTMYAGAGNGHALWDIGRQTLVYSDPNGGLTTRDTVRLGRRVNSSIVLGASMGLFSSARWGFSLDLAYRGFSFDDECVPIYLQADATGGTNQRLCDNITASANGGSVFAVTAGTVLRMASSRAVSPYLRGAVSVAHTTISTIAMAEPDAVGGEARYVIVDDKPRRISVNPVLAGGLTTSLGPGYQLRIEVRDELAFIERLDGPANALGVGPMSVSGFQHFSLIIGLDVVLEQKRVRRY